MCPTPRAGASASTRLEQRRAGRASLTAFLLGRGGPPPPETIRAAKLGAYAYTALPSDHPDRPGYRPDYLTSLARHQAIKRELAPLLAAWRDAGIEALLFKGFHLAEFVYPVPGARFHGDADVVIDPRHLRRAAGIAAELGWTGLPEPSDPPYRFRHAAYDLLCPGGATKVDLQRYVVHCVLPWAVRQRRLTRAVWERADERGWERTAVRVPHPVDAALVGLLVHRAWGGDYWGLKPHDLLDFRFLVEREGVTRAALEARAAELGGRRTLDAMLERCDPWAGRFVPGRLTRSRAMLLDLRTLPEHGPHRLEKALSRAARAPAVLPHVLRALPRVLQARRAARRERDLGRLLASFTPAPHTAPGAAPGVAPRTAPGPAPRTERSTDASGVQAPDFGSGLSGAGSGAKSGAGAGRGVWVDRIRSGATTARSSADGLGFSPRPRPERRGHSERISSGRRIWLARGIKWASRLVPSRGVGRCVIRSIALYHALREAGLPVEFVSGVRRDAHGVVGHAWVELDGRVLPELNEPDNRTIYRENFRYPPAAPRPGTRAAPHGGPGGMPGAATDEEPGGGPNHATVDGRTGGPAHGR